MGFLTRPALLAEVASAFPEIWWIAPVTRFPPAVAAFGLKASCSARDEGDCGEFGQLGQKHRTHLYANLAW